MKGRSNALDPFREVFRMRVVPHMDILILGNNPIIVLALPAFDILIGQNLIGQIIIGYNFHDNSPENHDDTHPLQYLKVMAKPQHIDHHCGTFPSVSHQG